VARVVGDGRRRPANKNPEEGKNLGQESHLKSRLLVESRFAGAVMPTSANSSSRWKAQLV
jgi:hypothetical protein